MKLSDALDRFFVVPFNSSEIVDFVIVDEAHWVPTLITITWEDHDEVLQRHEFTDQEVVIYTADSFMATSTEGIGIGFMALTGANLHVHGE